MEIVGQLELLRERIESLDKFHQVEILKILHRSVDHSLLNENNNGIFVNLTNLDKKVIDQIDNYMKYIAKQETQLDAFETQKEEIKIKYFFQKENKDKLTEMNNEY